MILFENVVLLENHGLKFPVHLRIQVMLMVLTCFYFVYLEDYWVIFFLSILQL